MTIWEAVLLGAVQGIFMFIPVSSTSHLALVQQVLIERGSSLPPPDSPDLILFDLIVHVGTLISVMIVFRHSLWRLVSGLTKELHAVIRRIQRPTMRYMQLAALGLLAMAMTGIIGVIILQSGAEEIFNIPELIALNLVITGIILWWTDKAQGQWRDPDSISPWVAAGIGIAQGIALLPGLSRSGLTIAAALWLGLKRRWAAEFSFFIAIPTIVAGSVVQTWIVVGDGEPLLVAPVSFAIGFVVAAVVGTGALLMVLRLLYKARFRVFSVYVWLLAALVLSGVFVHY